MIFQLYIRLFFFIFLIQHFFFGITYNRECYQKVDCWGSGKNESSTVKRNDSSNFNSMAMERLCCCCWLDDDKCWGECVWKGNDKLEETDWFPSDNFSHHHARLDCDTSAIGRTPLSRLRNSRSSNCFYPKNSHSIILVRGLRARLFNVAQLCVSVLLDYSWRWIFDNFFFEEKKKPRFACAKAPEIYHLEINQAMEEEIQSKKSLSESSKKSSKSCVCWSIGRVHATLAINAAPMWRAIVVG